MTRKSRYSAMAVVAAVVLAAGMVLGTAGVVLAEGEGAGNGVIHYSNSSQPEQAMDQSYTAEIRGPVETGALPGSSLTKPDSEGWVNMSVADQEASPDLQDAHNVQSP